jgi:TonB family protein
MTRTLAVLCALAVGASADAALSANDSIPLPRARSDGIGTTASTQAQASALANWGMALRAHMVAQSDYPALARLFKFEGVVQLSFVIDRQGAVRAAEIARSSGSRMLDGRTLRLLYQAQPFPPPPDELVGESFSFTIPVRYRLESQPESARQPGSAQQNFDRSVSDYRQCIAANPNNANACEGLRHIMDANAQVLSGHPHPDR